MCPYIDFNLTDLSELIVRVAKSGHLPSKPFWCSRVYDDIRDWEGLAVVSVAHVNLSRTTSTPQWGWGPTRAARLAIRRRWCPWPVMRPRWLGSSQRLGRVKRSPATRFASLKWPGGSDGDGIEESAVPLTGEGAEPSQWPGCGESHFR